MYKILFILLLFISLLDATIYTIKKNNHVSKKHFIENAIQLIIKFDSNTTIDTIDAFKHKYNLTLISKLKIGYYIFKDTSNTIISNQLIEQIIENEYYIKTIKPHMTKRMKAY